MGKNYSSFYGYCETVVSTIGTVDTMGIYNTVVIAVVGTMYAYYISYNKK